MAKTVMSELVVRMTAETAALKAEMERVRRSVDTAAKNMADKFDQTQKGVDSLAGGFRSLGGAIGAAFAGFSVVTVIQQIANLHDGIVNFQRSLKAVSGSTSQVGDNMTFVNNLAARLGMNINDVRQTFVSFAGAVKVIW